jgi:RNA polymerase sigma-32 factor
MSVHVGSSQEWIAEIQSSRYFTQIQQFPLLEAQQECMLARSWRDLGDRAAADRLVTSHLRLVARIARGYRGYGLPFSELISEGNIGLIRAITHFEPNRGARLATYATWWIRAAMIEYILHSSSLVKIGTTSNQKRLFFNLRRAKSRISATGAGDLRLDQAQLIATQLGVGEREVFEMNQRLGGDISLHSPARGRESGDWQDWLVDDRPNQETELVETEEGDNRKEALRRAIAMLSGREHRIFVARHLTDDPITLGELAVEFGVSSERVRQIERRAFKKVQSAIRTDFASA